jgi:hypothetical protein
MGAPAAPFYLITTAPHPSGSALDDAADRRERAVADGAGGNGGPGGQVKVDDLESELRFDIETRAARTAEDICGREEPEPTYRRGDRRSDRVNRREGSIRLEADDVCEAGP